MSAVIGALLMFTILILAYSGFQATVVPDQNQQVETTDYFEAQNDMTEVRSTILGTARTGGAESVTVQTGTLYPPGIFRVNPAPSAGSIRTGDPQSLEIRNAVATNTETADFWNASTDHADPTQRVVFAPQYHYADHDPVAVDATVTYINTSTSTQPLTDAVVVDGNTIRLIHVEGDVDRTGITSSVTFTGTSTGGDSIPVTNPNGGRITVVVPTEISAQTWRNELLSGELRSNGGNIRSISAVSGREAVEIEFVQGEVYNLQMAKVTATGTESGGETPAAAYITNPDASQRAVDVGGRVSLSPVVRDRFNNPRSGVSVSAQVVSGQSNVQIVSVDETTGSDGRVDVVVEGQQAGNAVVEVTFAGGGSDVKIVQYDVTVNGGGGGNGGGPGNGP